MTLLLGDTMQRLRAEDEIRRVYRNNLSAERWADLWLQATGDENVADKAWAQMTLAQIKTGSLKE